MTSGTGTCTVMYDQAGDTNYNPAPQITESVTALPIPTTRFVAPTGVDTGNCGNITTSCATITYAISQAVVGNTIEIAAGTYTEAGIIVSKNLTLTGAGAANTIVQAATTAGTATDRVLFINSGVTAILTNLTIQNGNPSGDGGGIYNSSSSMLTLDGATIKSNSASNGGGIFNNNGLLTISNGTFSGNLSTNGGGIYSQGYSINLSIIANTTFSSNTASNLGGGIYSGGALPTISNSTFSDNSANNGGGIYNSAPMTTISNSTFSNNSATSSGGGIYNSAPITNILNTTFAGNVAINGSGGGISAYHITTLNNSAFYNNSASNGSGGGLSNTNYIATISNSTFSGNAATSGGGINNPNNIQTISNSTFSGNSATSGGGINNTNFIGIISNSTFSGNLATLSGGAINNFGYTGTISNTIVANSLSGGNCSGIIPLGSRNLTDSARCGSWATTFVPNTHYNLALADNGCVTPLQDGSCVKTHALLFTTPTNPALDFSLGGTTTDERGFAAVGARDIGAFEFIPPPMTNQTITVTRNAPLSAYAGDEFRVEATASSGLPVIYSTYGDCTNLNEIFTIHENDPAVDDICYVRIRQDGDSTYNPALPVTQEVIYLNTAPVIDEGNSVTVTMSQDSNPIPFNLTLHATDPDLDVLGWSVSALAQNGKVNISVVNVPPDPNEPKQEQKCSQMVCGKAVNITYTPIVSYSGTDSFTVRVNDSDLAEDMITVNVIIEPSMLDQTISVNTHAPTNAILGDTFTVEAVADSGLPVTYSSSGACTNIEGEFTIINTTGDCIVMYDQAGDSAYNPAPQVVEYAMALNPMPSITAISPASAQAGNPDITLSISGTDFVVGVVARWHDGAIITELATTLNSSSNLSAVIPSALLATAGTFEVSVLNPAPGGGSSGILPFFVTQSSAEVISTDIATSTDPDGTAVVSTGGNGPGTPDSISASAVGIGTVAVSTYDSNPTGTSPFTVAGTYFDVYLSEGSNFSSMTIVACNLSGNAKIRWWNGSAWVQVNPQSNANGCITMQLSDTSSPTISQLTGTIFGVGEYSFIGFISPVDNPEIVNTGKAGRTYPIKWQLKDGDGLLVSDLTAITSITYVSHSCSAFTGDPTNTLEVSSTGNTNLRYDSTINQFIYNWKTPSVGCYTLFLTLDTGQVFHAYFNLK